MAVQPGWVARRYWDAVYLLQGMRGAASITLLLLALAWPAAGQTTQGLIAGRVVDAQTGAGVPGATLTCSAATARSGPGGYYALPLLPPDAATVKVLL